jgi:uncharacterized iron-regulated membrane protein
MTLPFRQVLFWMHLTAGVVAGLVILLMSVTGVLLAYEKQIIRMADGFHAPPTTPGQPRLPLEDVVARAQAGRAAPSPATVVLRRDTNAPVEVAFGREGSVFVNAYTGQVLGSGSTATRAFFRSMMEWHRWLALKDASRATGKMITGVSNLLFLFIVISGFYLWWPRTWTWTQFRQVLWFRGGLRGKARDFNWHHVIGYWSLVPLAVIVWSGVVIGYPWASNLTFRMAGEEPPRPAPQAAARPGEAGSNPRAAAPPATDAAPGYLPTGDIVAAATAHAADWTILTVRIPKPADPLLQMVVDTGTGAQPQTKDTLHLQRASGEVAKVETFAAQSRGRQWRSWMRFVHTGEYYGLTGQTIAMLVTAGACVLVWTGLALTWRRFAAWRARAAAGARGARTAA